MFLSLPAYIKQKATLLRDSIFLLAFFQMPIKNRIRRETKLKEMCELASARFVYAKQQFKPSVY